MEATISQDQKEKILDKVKKLLALADTKRNSNEYEAAIAAAKAQELLLRYNLSVDEIKDVNEDDVTQMTFASGSRRPPLWESILLNMVAKTFYCKAIRNYERNYILVGAKVDVEVAHFTFDYLKTTVIRLAEQYVQKNSHIGHGKTVRVSYSLGAADSIIETLERMVEETEQQVQKELMTTALVVMKEVKLRNVKDFTKKNFPKLEPGNTPSFGNDSAYFQGKCDGKNVKIVQGVR